LVEKDIKMGASPAGRVLLQELDAMVARAKAACARRRQAVDAAKARKRRNARLVSGLWSMERALRELQERREIEVARLQEHAARALNRLR